jgi:CheY-like chemotaxis protein
VDGITATYWLRNQSYVTPILAMTAFDDPKERERCLKAGMNDFMIKPFEPDTLYSLIYRWTVGKGEPAGQDQYIPMNQQTTDIAAVSEIALDVILGFSRVGNNPQLYQQILGTFRDEYSDQGRKLLAMVEREEWVALERIAHNLKSVARYIGADGLSHAASELELLLRRQEARASRAIMTKKLVANIHILLMAVFDIIKSIPVIAKADPSSSDDLSSPEVTNKKQDLPKILVIDDELIHRQMLSSLLQHDGEVFTVADGATALELVFTQPVDLILLDMVMPDVRGDEVMRQLRSHPATRDIDIVIISSRNDVEDESTERRGQLSVNAIFNNKVAVLAGDYLLATALVQVGMTRNHDIIDIVSCLGQDLADGELLQLSNVSNLHFSEEVYFDVIRKKTCSKL